MTGNELISLARRAVASTSSRWALAGVGGTALAGLISFALIARTVTASGLGQYATITAAVALAAALGRFGGDYLVVQYVAERPDHPWAAIARTVARAVAGPTIICSIAVFGFSLYTLEGGNLRVGAALAAGVATFAESPRLILAEAMRCRGHYGRGTLAGGLGRGVTAAVGGLIVFACGIRDPDAVVILISAMSLLPYALFSGTGLTRSRPTQREGLPSSPTILRSGAPLFLAGLGSLAITLGDMILVGTIYAPAEASDYAIALRLGNILMLPLYVAAFMSMPILAAAIAAGRIRDAQPKLQKIALLTTAASALGLVMLVVAGPLLIQLISGKRSDEVLAISLVLAAGVLINSATGPCANAFAVTGRGRTLAIVNLTAVGFAVAAAVACYSAGMGPIAIAASFALAMALQNAFLAWLSSRALGLRTWAANPFRALPSG